MIKEEGNIPPLGWSSLFETPRLSPVGIPTPTSKVQEEALHIIAAGSPIMISWNNLQRPCKVYTKGLTNNGNMCFLNSVIKYSVVLELEIVGLASLDTLRAFGKSIQTPSHKTTRVFGRNSIFTSIVIYLPISFQFKTAF